MDAHEDTRRIQVLSVSDTGRRRRWTDDEKIRIVEESHGDGVTLAELARRHDISRSQLYDWRYRHKHGLLGAIPQFLRVLQVADCSGPDLNFYVSAVARLGGYLDRTSDAPPGTTVIWRGLSRLADLAEGAGASR